MPHIYSWHFENYKYSSSILDMQWNCESLKFTLQTNAYKGICIGPTFQTNAYKGYV